jgi:hypothetical protein
MNKEVLKMPTGKKSESNFVTVECLLAFDKDEDKGQVLALCLFYDIPNNLPFFFQFISVILSAPYISLHSFVLKSFIFRGRWQFFYI